MNKENTARRKTVDGKKEGTYTVVSTGFGAEELPQVVSISFEMPYPGWCLLEQSDVWRSFLETLADVQSTAEYRGVHK